MGEEDADGVLESYSACLEECVKDGVGAHVVRFAGFGTACR